MLQTQLILLTIFKNLFFIITFLIMWVIFTLEILFILLTLNKFKIEWTKYYSNKCIEIIA